MIFEITNLKSPHEENTFELLHLLLVRNALKIFVSIRMKHTSYTHKFSNITNFPYNTRLVVIFTTFRYEKDFYISLLKGPERVAIQIYSVVNNWVSAQFCVPSCPISSSFIELIGRHWSICSFNKILIQYFAEINHRVSTIISTPVQTLEVAKLPAEIIGIFLDFIYTSTDKLTLKEVDQYTKISWNTKR